MKKTMLAATVALLSFMNSPAQDYRLVWSDEFDSNTLGVNWNVEVAPRPANNELQYYTDRDKNVKIEKGNLVLTGIREEYGGRHFTSGRVNSCEKVNFKHGKIQARIKLPKTARGLWPAFWMMGDDIRQVGWPKCYEIDIMEIGHSNGYENNNEEKYFSGALHWGKDTRNHKFVSYDTFNSYSVQDGEYHIFTCTWDENEICFYVDDVPTPYFREQVGKETEHYQYAHKPHHILFNLAVGGDFPGLRDAKDVTALPKKGSKTEMLVDWVRVYQKTANAKFNENDAEKVECPHIQHIK